MMKWLSGEEGEPGSTGPGPPRGGAPGGGDVITEAVGVEEMAERLAHAELLLAQLKELIREKDAALHAQDARMKVEKEACESRLSKLRLQNKAKVTSLTSQLEELKQQQGGGTPTHGRKGSSDAAEHASRGKVVLLKKKLEDLDQQLARRGEELEEERKEAESQRQRGEEMDAMLAERDRKLAEKEAYIVHLQTALAGDRPASPAPQQQEDGAALQELQLLVQSLTRKVGEEEERYSLLQEQAGSLKELLAHEQEHFLQKENMYKQNIQTFKDILLQKDQQLVEAGQTHEQELFKLAAKSDASADLEQLLKALKQKLHEKEEVLMGKTQVIDVLQGEVDGRDQQIQDLVERLRRLHVERESLASKMEAEKHVMRAQLRDLMEKQQAEVQRVTEQHRVQMDRAQQDLLGQLEEQRRSSGGGAIPEEQRRSSGGGAISEDSVQRMAELEARSKQKTEEAERSEAKFMKMKAWSKSRIRQLEEELKKSQAGGAPPDATAMRGRITALEEEREENLWKAERYEELKAKNDMLEAKLVVYEEQQRTLHADLEQFTKRTASQASESGSADEAQSQVLEWQEMVAEAAGARDRAEEERAAMALRMSHMEEEREALASRQQELEEELAGARGPGRGRAGGPAEEAQRSLQEDFGFDGRPSFAAPRPPPETPTPMEGENMGGWWPEFSSPDTEGLRSVVEELELERNQLQEQILSLEERCQQLEERQQLQARVEALQSESERLQAQVSGLRLQQSREAENQQLLVAGLTEQLKGLSSTQGCLESSLVEKENALAKTSEELQLAAGLRAALDDSERRRRDAAERLLQAERALQDVSTRCGGSEKRRSELQAEVAELTQRTGALKEKTQKQAGAAAALQAELEQSNEELDKLNGAHLEERAQLIHELQGSEREADRLKEALLDKEEELQTLSGGAAAQAERLAALRREAELRDQSLARLEAELQEARREAASGGEEQLESHRALLEESEARGAALEEREEAHAAEMKAAKEEQKELLARLEEEQLERARSEERVREEIRQKEETVAALERQLERRGEEEQEEQEQEQEQLGVLMEELERRRRRGEELNAQMCDALEVTRRQQEESGAAIQELSGRLGRAQQEREEEAARRREAQQEQQEQLSLLREREAALQEELRAAAAEREDAKEEGAAAEAREAELLEQSAALREELEESRALLDGLRREKEAQAAAGGEERRSLQDRERSTAAALEEGRSQLLQLQAALQEREQEAAALRAQEEALGKEAQRRESEARRTDENLRALEAELQRALTEAERLRTAGGDADAKLQAALSEREGLNSAALEQQRLIQRLGEREQSAAHAAAGAERSARDLGGRVGELEGEAARLQAALTELGVEAELLKKALEDKEAELLERGKSLQDARARLEESGERLAADREKLRRTGAALQEKNAAAAQEEEALRSALGEERRAAAVATETLREELERSRRLNAGLAQEKAAAAPLGAELERLREQHRRVVHKMDALTENLEQREAALHAINARSALQAEHAAQRGADTQRLSEEGEELRRRLAAAAHTNALLQEEGAELQRRLRELQAQMERRSGSWTTEKENLQAQDTRQKSSGHQGAAVRCEEDEAERTRLHGDLQRCRHEIQRLGLKVQQAEEEKGGAAARLRVVSQSLRDAEARCQRLEAQGAELAQEAPGAPQERSSEQESSRLRERLLELEQNLSEERTRRETLEERLRLMEDAQSLGSRDGVKDFSIEMELEEDWAALSPGTPLLARQVKGGAAACRRWLRGRSLYFSRLLSGRARSRYLFLAYLLTVHLLLLMSLTGAL